MEAKPTETIPYATPLPRHGLRGWLARRASTSGLRLIALAAMAFVGATCMSPGQTNLIAYNAGETILRIAPALFALEYLLSFFQ
jgi:hypothetical protein